MKVTRRLSLLMATGILWLGCGQGALASIWQPLSGLIDLSAVQSELDGRQQNTLRQEYNGTFTKSLAPYLDLRLGMRYYKFDQDLDLALGSYREEVQPSGEFRWTHPLFQFSTTGMRRRVTTSAEAAIITNDLQFIFQTRDTDYPLLKMSFDEQHTYFPDNPLAQDIRNKRLQIGADYSKGRNSFSYNFSRLRTENVVSSLASRSLRHLLRWNGQSSGGASQRWSLTGGVTSQYLDETDEVQGDGPVLELIPAQAGLYARDDSPDLDPLDEVTGLVDGNTSDPTSSPIDIGGGNIDINLGVDMGGPVPVAGLYIYTDRPSGLQVSWRVYVSTDNLSWDSWSALPEQVFNEALNRYEVTFPAANLRYIKVVNSGLNEVAQVMITELEVLRERSANGTDQRLAFINILDGRVGYRFSDRWQTSFDLSLQHSELMGRAGDRTQHGLGWRLNYQPSRVLSHHVRVEVSGQGGNGGEISQEDRSLGYTMVFQPLPTWRGSFSASDRLTNLDGEKSQVVLGSALENTLSLLQGLDLRISNAWSRTDDFLGDVRIDSWNSQLGVEAFPRQGLSVMLTGYYQESEGGTTAGKRVRRSGNMSLDWRPGKLIYVRANLQGVVDNTDSVIRDILIGWNLLPKVRFSGQAYDLRMGGVTTTKRLSLNVNMELSNRRTLYLRVAEVDLTGGGGSKTVSFQQGFRAGF